MPKVNKQIKKIKFILSKEQNEIVQTAFLLMLPALLTKISGLFFNLLAASLFGTDDPGWNQFIIANAIPELLANVLLIGAVGTVLIPILISCIQKEGKESFFNVYSSIINISVIAFSVISLVLIILLGDIYPFLLDNIIRPEKLPEQDEINLIVNMTRVLLFPQLILGISVFVSSGLNAYSRFLVPQLAPLFYNIGRIIAIFTILPMMDFDPWALVIGVLLGSILHLGVQVPLFQALHLKYRFVIDLKNIYLKEVYTLGLPRMLAIASEHIAFTINKFIAFGVDGAAALIYANSLSLVIPSIFGYTFSIASFPTLAKLHIEKNHKTLKNVIQKTLNEILFLALPFSVTFMVLRVPVVRFAFGLLPNTNLDINGTYQIAWVLLWFSLGWVFVSGKWFMYRVFYAVKDTFTPLIISSVSLILTIIFSILFTNLFSHNTLFAISDIHLSWSNFFSRSTGDAAVGGIAFAMSITYSIEFFILVYIFSKTKTPINLKKLFFTSSKKFAAGGAMFVVMYIMFKTWGSISYTLPEMARTTYTGSTTFNLFILTVITTITGFMVYYLLCLLLKVEELRILKKYLNPIFRIGGLRIK